jgi:hypothetical protein
MPKTFYTERDIDDMHARGVTSIEIHDGIVLTDLARERAFKHGIRLQRGEAPATPKTGLPPAPPPAVSQEALVQQIKTAVLARLNGQVDPAVLDAVIRKVIAAMK